MPDYARLQETAQRLVAGAGGSFTFRSFSTTVADGNKPWDGPTDPRGTGAATSVETGVLVDPGGIARLGVALETDDLIKRSEKILIIAGSTTDLRTFHEVDSADGPFKITAVKRLIPDNSTTILWFVGLAR